MNTDSSSAQDYRRANTFHEYGLVKDITSAHKPLRKQVVEKTNARNTQRKHIPNAKKRTVPAQWDPIAL